MRFSYYPQSLAQVRGAIREIEVWIWGFEPRGFVHAELPRLHRSDRSDWWVPIVGYSSSELLNQCVFGSCFCWSVLVCFGGVLLGFVKSSSLQGVFLGVFWLQGLEKSLRLSGTLVVRLLQPPT
jgi:hypothetical protein